MEYESGFSSPPLLLPLHLEQNTDFLNPQTCTLSSWEPCSLLHRPLHASSPQPSFLTAVRLEHPTVPGPSKVSSPSGQSPNLHSSRPFMTGHLLVTACRAPHVLLLAPGQSALPHCSREVVLAVLRAWSVLLGPVLLVSKTGLTLDAVTPGGAWNATPRSLPSLERKIRSRTHA